MKSQVPKEPNCDVESRTKVDCALHHQVHFLRGGVRQTGIHLYKKKYLLMKFNVCFFAYINMYRYIISGLRSQKLLNSCRYLFFCINSGLYLEKSLKKHFNLRKQFLVQSIFLLKSIHFD